MFGGMGGGRGLSGLRMVRLGALVVFLVLAATLHDKGPVYNTLHIVYIVLIVGLLALSFAGRARRGPRGPGAAGTGADGPDAGRDRFGSGPPPVPPPTPATDHPDPEVGG